MLTYREAIRVFGLGFRFRPERRFPVGVWIAADLLIGTGFACGGWAIGMGNFMSLTVKTYHPLVRPALLASLFWLLAGRPVGHYRRRSLLEPAVLHSEVTST